MPTARRTRESAKVDLDVDATDTNTKAEGTRSVKRGETLKMVHGKQAGETRTTDVQLSIDSPVNIPLPSNFPQWKGPGKVEPKLCKRIF